MLPTDEVDKFNLGEDAVNPDKPMACSALAEPVSASAPAEPVSAPATLVSSSTKLLLASGEPESALAEELSVSGDRVCGLAEWVFGWKSQERRRSLSLEAALSTESTQRRMRSRCLELLRS